MTRTSTSGLQHGLLFLDLDRFKLVNDSYGHMIGDKLLIQVSNRLLSGLSPADSVARMSGDEFVILVEDANDLDTMTRVAERLLHILQEPFEVDSHHIFMSASIGVGLTRDGQGRDETLAMVDAAAYAAKAAGRNCYCVSTDASVDETRARLDLEVSLRQGLDENELELHYQPIVTTDGSEVIGCRGAGAVALAEARHAVAAAVRADRRGDRPDRPDGALGARRGVPHDARLDPGPPGPQAALRVRSTCRRCSSPSTGSPRTSPRRWSRPACRPRS